MDLNLSNSYKISYKAIKDGKKPVKRVKIQSHLTDFEDKTKTI